MRTVERIFVAAGDVAVDAQAALARAAEEHGLEGVWVHGPSSRHGDSYATTAAAAVASATTDLRVGVVLRVSAPEDVLRLAEDLAVLDHCSSGRAEVCLDGRWAHDAGAPTWSADALRLMTNLRSCPVGDRQIAVTPGPLQPAIPAVALGQAIVGMGTVAPLDGPAVQSPRTVRYLGTQRTQALIEAAADPGTLRDAIEQLRGEVDRCGAQDIVFVLPTGASSDAGSNDDHVRTLACVIAPILRANEDEVADLVLDTLKFQKALPSRR